MHWIGCSIIVSLISTKPVRFTALELYRPNLGELLAVEAPDETLHIAGETQRDLVRRQIGRKRGGNDRQVGHDAGK